MKKTDLKNMMIVEMRSGQRWLVVGDKLYNKSGHISLSYFTHDLRHVELAYRDDDIMRVYAAANYLPILSDYDIAALSVLGERKEELELFSGQAVYIGINDLDDSGFTIGKIYSFKGGKTIDDDNDIRPIDCADVVEKHNTKMYGFLPIVE